MNSSIVVIIFLCIAIVAAIDVMHRSVDGFLVVKRESALKSVMRKLTKNKQPHVTVLVMDSGGQGDGTVRSLRRQRYVAFDVVRFEKRRAQTEVQAYRSAYRKSQHGKIVVCLRAGEVVDPYFLKRVVVSRRERDRWCVEVTQPLDSQGISGMAMALQSALWGSSIAIEVYSARIFRKVPKPGWRFQGRALWTWSLIAVGIILGVIVFGLEMLWYSWILFATYLLCVVWIQQGISLRERLGRSFAVPSALFFMPISSLIQGVFQLGTRK